MYKETRKQQQQQKRKMIKKRERKERISIEMYEILNKERLKISHFIVDKKISKHQHHQ